MTKCKKCGGAILLGISGYGGVICICDKASPPTDTAPKSVEQKLRDVLERMGIDDAQKLTSGDLVELANWVSGIQPTDEVKLPKAEYDALVADAERWKTLCELWLLCTEMSLIQNEDGGYSIIMVEPVDNGTFKDLVGDTPEQAIDSAKGK